jgi:hypothetical protein
MDVKKDRNVAGLQKLPPHITYSNRKKISFTDMSYIHISSPKMVGTVIIVCCGILHICEKQQENNWGILKTHLLKEVFILYVNE